MDGNGNVGGAQQPHREMHSNAPKVRKWKVGQKMLSTRHEEVTKNPKLTIMYRFR